MEEDARQEAEESSEALALFVCRGAVEPVPIGSCAPEGCEWSESKTGCRAPNLLNTKRLLESLRDPEREASQENLDFVFHLLPGIEDPFGPRQAMSISSASLEQGKDHRDPAAGRPASPL